MRDLFNSASTDPKSEIFTVPHNGGGVLLKLFGAPGGLCIKFEMIAYEEAKAPHGEKCKGDIDIFSKPVIKFAQSIEQSGNWLIERDNNLGIMVVPGLFRAVIQPEYLGDFTLTMEEITQSAVQNTPSHLRYGWINNPDLEDEVPIP